MFTSDGNSLDLPWLIADGSCSGLIGGIAISLFSEISVGVGTSVVCEI